VLRKDRPAPTAVVISATHRLAFPTSLLTSTAPTRLERLHSQRLCAICHYRPSPSHASWCWVLATSVCNTHWLPQRQWVARQHPLSP